MSDKDRPELQPTSKVAPISKDAPEQQTQKLNVYFVEPTIFDEMVKSLEKLPREDTKLLWKHIESMQAMGPQPVDVTLKPE